MVDTAADLVKSIEEDNTTSIAAFGVSLAPAAVDAAPDPVDVLRGSGVDWLIDHLHVLREPLDLLAGDNTAVRDEAEKISADASKYAGVAAAHFDALEKLESWTGTTADAFKRSMTRVGDELRAIGVAMRGSAEIMTTMGDCVTAFRSLVRDIVATVVDDLIGGAIIAASLAAATAGTSIAAFVGTAVTTAVEALDRILGHITDLKSLLTANKAATDRLGSLLVKISDDAARFDRGGLARSRDGR